MRVEIDTDWEREQAATELAAAQLRFNERMEFLDRIEKSYASTASTARPLSDYDQPNDSLSDASEQEWRGIRPAVREALPHLKEITRVTVLAQIQRAHPGAAIDEAQVDSALRRLLARGELRRVREAQNGYPAVFAPTGAQGREESSAD